MTFTTGGPWQNVTIRNVTYSDSGRYQCDSDFKNIRVLNPGQSEKLLNIIFRFFFMVSQQRRFARMVVNFLFRLRAVGIAHNPGMQTPAF